MLVKTLHAQATHIGICYEIIIAEDGSTDKSTINANHQLSTQHGVRHIVLDRNIGRSAVRNMLIDEAAYKRLLLIDADMTITHNDFLLRYLETEGQVVYGGYSVNECNTAIRHGLRYHYEYCYEKKHPLKKRQENPYQNFRTSCFMAQREVMKCNPFDECFRYYGYEDVALGKKLQESGVTIVHINNPVCPCHFESNKVFIEKTEEALLTLYMFRHELMDYSALLSFVEKIKRRHMLTLLHTVCNCCKKPIRALLYKHDFTLLFQFYKLCYFVSLLP